MVHICTWPIGPFNLELKCSFMVDFHMVFFTLLSTLGGLKPQMGGCFGCVVPFKIFMCYGLKCSFMVDFHMIFFTVLSTLGGPKPQIGELVYMCCTI
jgi:hypothetical protein